MNCGSVGEKLSAYLDGELRTDDAFEVRNHLASCESCSSELEQFVAMGGLVRCCEADDQAPPAWETVENLLERNSARRESLPVYWSRWGTAVLATAASLGLMWLAISRARHTDSDPHTAAGNVHAHSAMAVDFQDVFQSAQTEPKRAIGRLVAKYQGKELDHQGTIDYLGYEPALFRSVPAGFTRTSTHVLNMPCCKCSATVCRRQDGTSLIVFEHKEEQPVWFGAATSTETQCAGKPCRLIESMGNLAVTWKIKDRQLTMIGAKDLSEASEWMSIP